MIKGNAIAAAISAMLIASPTHADGGKATCAGKTYLDITYATISELGYFAVVSLWLAPVSDAKAAKQTRPQFTIVMNSDMYCEMQDVWLRRITRLDDD